MSLAMKAAKFSGGQPILRGGFGPPAGTTTFGGSGFERFAGPMAYGRGAMMAGNGMYGDPGLFSFLGGVVKKATGIVSRLGIPIVSGVAGAVSGLIPGQQPAALPAGPGLPGVSAFTGIRPISLQTAAQIPTRGVVGAIQRAVPGGATGMEGCGGGYRANKSGYYVQGGQYVAPGTVCVKRRRMNPLNPRALSKAMRRIESAKRATKVLGRISIKKPC